MGHYSLHRRMGCWQNAKVIRISFLCFVNHLLEQHILQMDDPFLLLCKRSVLLGSGWLFLRLMDFLSIAYHMPPWQLSRASVKKIWNLPSKWPVLHQACEVPRSKAEISKVIWAILYFDIINKILKEIKFYYHFRNSFTVF